MALRGPTRDWHLSKPVQRDRARESTGRVADVSRARVSLMMDLQRGLFVATICAFAGASARASTPPPPWPEGFSLVTIEGSRTYKILKSGGISGKGGKRLGMGILYATTSTDL